MTAPLLSKTLSASHTAIRSKISFARVAIWKKLSSPAPSACISKAESSCTAIKLSFSDGSLLLTRKFMYRDHRSAWRDSLAPPVTCDQSDFGLYLDISKEYLIKTGEIPLSGACLAEDLKFELSILATVQGFCQKLMWATLGGDVPLPAGLDEASLRLPERDLPAPLSRMYLWLHLLDMAIPPAMLRQALTP